MRLKESRLPYEHKYLEVIFEICNHQESLPIVMTSQGQSLLGRTNLENGERERVLLRKLVFKKLNLLF